jgi:hypothetical protein
MFEVFDYTEKENVKSSPEFSAAKNLGPFNIHSFGDPILRHCG